MTQYPTCTHMKEDGTYCGSPALVNRRYCYFHLTQRGRRLRRARALRDQVNYRLDLPPLEDLASGKSRSLRWSRRWAAANSTSAPAEKCSTASSRPSP